MVQQLPLVHLIHKDRVRLKNTTEEDFKRIRANLSTDGTPPAVLPLVGGILHARGDQPVAAQQVPLQTLVREKPELALLAVQRWPIVDHLRVDFHLGKKIIF